MTRNWSAAVAAALLVTTLAACGNEPSDGSNDPPAADGPAAPEALPAPESGFSWLSWRDVAVQVPVGWDLGGEPSTDWCVGHDPDKDPPTREPYYSLDPASGGVLDILCPDPGKTVPEEFGPAPESLWATHVVLEPDDGSPDHSLTEGRWTLSTKAVGDVRVRVLAAEADVALVEGILDSARRFTVDHNGCEPTSPVQAAEFVRPEPYDVTRITEADSISICQYARSLGPDDPALMGSRRANGAEADAILAGLQEAPPGTGPDRPKNCVDDLFGDTALALRIHEGEATHEVYAYYDWCFGNGTDDGVQHRELTSDTCAPLFDGTVRILQYSSHLRGICSTD